MRKGLIGLVLGGAAAVWAYRRYFGSGDSGATDTYTAGGMDAAVAGSAGPGTAPRREGLDPTLLEILACPDDKQPVIYQKEGDAERLTCTVCGKRYPVREGIPVMLIDEATPGPVPTEAEVAAARAVAKEGKPAIVGASVSATGAAPASTSASNVAGTAGAASASASGTTGSGTTGSGTSAPSATASPTASGATSGTAAGESAPTGTSAAPGGSSAAG